MNAWSHLPQSFTPREIEIRLGQLIRGYLKRRSTALATAVVRYIEALCAHPDYCGSWEERCAYRRLARHWSGLAWIAADRPDRPSIASCVTIRRSVASC